MVKAASRPDKVVRSCPPDAASIAACSSPRSDGGRAAEEGTHAMGVSGRGMAAWAAWISNPASQAPQKLKPRRNPRLFFFSSLQSSCGRRPARPDYLVSVLNQTPENLDARASRKHDGGWTRAVAQSPRSFSLRAAGGKHVRNSTTRPKSQTLGISAFFPISFILLAVP